LRCLEDDPPHQTTTSTLPDRGQTVWLTQKALAELFGVKVPAINKHLKNIFDSGELIEDSVSSI